jgi:hypothetical protein
MASLFRKIPMPAIGGAAQTLPAARAESGRKLACSFGSERVLSMR